MSGKYIVDQEGNPITSDNPFPTKLTGSNVLEDGSVKTSMTTALDKSIDSVSAEIIDGKVKAAFAITPNDAADLTYPTTMLYVGVAGDVTVDLTGAGTSLLFKALPVGFHQICAKRVYATGTTATSLVGIYHV